jgi:hypothetical protein
MNAKNVAPPAFERRCVTEDHRDRRIGRSQSACAVRTLRLLAHHRAQCVALIDEQAALALRRVNGEEIRSTWDAMSTVVWRGTVAPKPM